MATWQFSGTPTYSNATFTGNILVNGFLPNPYQLVYRVQLTNNTNKVFLGSITSDPRFVTRDFTQTSLSLSFNQYIGVDVSTIKFIDIAITNANERPSNATGQRRALLNLLHWEPSGTTSQIYTGILVQNPLGQYVPYQLPPNSNVPVGITATTPTNLNPQTVTTPVMSAPNPQGSVSGYFHFTVRLPNNIKDFIITFATLNQLTNLNWGSIPYRYEPLIGVLPSYVGVSSFNDVVSFAGLQTTSTQPPSNNNAPPPQSTGNAGGFGASIFGIILGIAAVGSLIPSGVRRLRRRKSKK